MTIRFLDRMRKLQADEAGQGLVEYALILALVSFSAVVTMHTLAQDINNAFTGVGNVFGSYVP
jgi:Flp pilus assembly pilin Flp